MRHVNFTALNIRLVAQRKVVEVVDVGRPIDVHNNLGAARGCSRGSSSAFIAQDFVRLHVLVCE